MDCTTGTMVSCRAVDGGDVRFSLAAVQAYSADQAHRYAATHDTGPATPPSSAPSAPAPKATPNDGGSACDSTYEGACLDPNAIDYDCEGGSGDGPEYSGVVTVVGDDHFDLDRDRDGIGCDS